ncbi:RNA polymerase sigma factor SigJ [Patulibacter sp.]|uniref:RNA polymerase sigma factor SigJ n=1 Tax=Patulibacter sp. TaxID=1912859 RepID=UPI002727AA31|nr:RNA polymerase sigma factor SigJ [Patulibacter sp.]MDO9408813.1 RNA polymerase sigma factor SigJ [Patulibacter sp.]
MSAPDLEAPRQVAFAIAYRMLGSVAEAEDVAQEAALRLDRHEGPVDNPDAWVTTVATRLSIDVLRSARVRREAYVGPWLPEPLLVDPGPGPAARAELADTLSQALLVALERLTPLERAAFLLREVFDYDYARIAEIVDRSEPSARQLVSRAKRHVAAGRPRFDPDDAARDRLLERFSAAVEGGDLGGLEELLASEVVLWGDGGGEVVAARIPVHGPAAVARFLVHTTVARRRHGAFTTEAVRVNGQPGQVIRGADGTAFAVLSFDVVDGRVATIRIVRNPAKLAHLTRAPD